MAPHERDHTQHEETQQNEQEKFSHHIVYRTSAHVPGQMNDARF
ncbi:MAG: hypothetical protein OJF52_001801 [Nitrospira sp.]|jgi:hypothetical protein|nr:MAG: hypothetical protein OJF52_001801 [Nitrospira sp.]